MAAYMIIRAIVTDAEKFADYGPKAALLVEKYGGHYEVMRPAHNQILEGDWNSEERIVMSKWPSVEHALAFWHSDEYAEVKKLRENAGEVFVRLVEATS